MIFNPIIEEHTKSVVIGHILYFHLIFPYKIIFLICIGLWNQRVHVTGFIMDLWKTYIPSSKLDLQVQVLFVGIANKNCLL